MQRATHTTHTKRLLTNRLARAEASCRLLLRCKDTKNQCLTQTFYKIYDFFALIHILINILAIPAPDCTEPKKGGRGISAPPGQISQPVLPASIYLTITFLTVLPAFTT